MSAQEKQIEVLVEENRFELSRIQDLSSGEVLLKKTYRMSKTEKSKIAFHYMIQEDFRLTANFQGKGVLSPLKQEKAEDAHFIYYANMQGDTLQSLMDNALISTNFLSTLTIAIAIAECVEHFHDAKLIVHNLTPTNIFVKEDFSEAKLIDLQTIQPITKKIEKPKSIQPHTYYYSSPEWIEASEKVDNRSDIYSLGLLLYKLFVGKHPYETSSQSGTIYSHLAIEPIPPTTINLEIPSVLSIIIMRCLEKNIDLRYSSIKGLLKDLRICKKLYIEEGSIYNFPLTTRYTESNRLLFNTQFERKSEEKLADKVLESALGGTNQLMIISGPADIGKTTFIQHLLNKKAYDDRYVFSLSANVQQSKKQYGILLQGVSQFIEEVLLKEEQQLAFWREQILKAMSGYGQLLIEQVPRLELLIGKQPQVMKLPLRETQTRLEILLWHFYQLLVEQNFNTVLLIDDMQWVDEASINIFFRLIKEVQDESVVMICTYNEEEMSILHPFLREVNRLSQAELPVTLIQLQPFSLTEVSDEFKRLTERDDFELTKLTNMIYEKTDGRPYALSVLMKEIGDKGYLFYDETHAIWRFDLPKINELMTPQVKSNMRLQKLYSLSPEDSVLIGCATYIGEQFSLQMLATITETPLEIVRLWAEWMVNHRLIQPKQARENLFCFQHADIFHAAKNLIAEEEKVLLQFRCGLYLLEQGDVEKEAEHILLHWHECLSLVVEHGYEEQLIKLSLDVGARYYQQYSYQTARSYYHIANELLEDYCWKKYYALTFQVKKQLAETEFLCANFERSTSLYQEILRHTPTRFERVRILNEMIKVSLSQDQYKESVELGLKALRSIGIVLEVHPSKIKTIWQYRKLKNKLKKMTPEKMRTLPQMDNEEYRLAMKIFANITDPMYVESQIGWFHLVLTMLEVTIEHGMTEEAAYAFANYAVVLNWQFKEYEEAYKWGKLGCDVSKHNPVIYNRVYMTYLHCVDSWRQVDPDFLIRYADHASKSALLAGNIWQATQGTLTTLAFMLQFGYPLDDMYRRLQAIYPNLLHNSFEMHKKQATILAHIITTLTKQTAPLDPFVQVNVEEAAFYENSKGDSDKMLKELVQVYLYITNYLYGNYEKAAEAVDTANWLVESQGNEMLQHTTHHYYYMLIYKELYPALSKQEQRQLLQSFIKKIADVKKLAKKVPINYLHKYLYMKAEYAKLVGDLKKAEKLFEQAIIAAKNAGAIHDVGIIAENIAKYGLQINNLFIARIYMNEAYEAYHQWGANGKVEQLQKNYSFLLHPPHIQISELDAQSIANFMQIFKQETNLDNMIQMIMPIMIKNAKATYGALVLGRDEQMAELKLFGSADQLNVQLHSLSETSSLLPKELISYVYRTREVVVINDGQKHSLFAKLSYFQTKPILSAICLPIMAHNEMLGVIYLENHLYNNLYTKARVSWLDILRTQFSITIANAYLIQDLEKQNQRLEEEVRKRTLELELALMRTEPFEREMVGKEQDFLDQSNGDTQSDSELASQPAETEGSQ